MTKLCDETNLRAKDNEMEILYRELKREMDALVDDTNLRILVLDGKIADAVVYLKTNLTNEIRLLLETMDKTGELDSLISEFLINDITLIKDALYPKGNVKRYGAVGDGITNDTAALNLACEDARIHKVPLVADEGTYRITDDVNMRYITKINFAGNIVCDNGSSVIIGDSSSNFTGCDIKLNEVTNIVVRGLKNSLLEYKSCENLTLFANGDLDTDYSVAYNSIYASYTKNILLDSIGDEIGWINENVFRIKRVENITIGGNYDHNNNHFEHCNLEKGTLNLLNARNNYFKARCEGDITVNETSKSQANFIEKEFYYKHYFGEDVIHGENGTITYRPVNKIQVEKTLLQIDKNNREYKTGALHFKQDGSFIGEQYNTIYKSNLIKIDSSFALKLKASSKAVRVQLNFYDENKTRILTPVDNFNDGKMNYVTEQSYSYAIQSNVDNDIVNVFPGRAKYIEYEVLFGSNIADITLEYIMIKLVKLVNTDIHITNTIKTGYYDTIPTRGYFEKGQILLSNNPSSENGVGIVCIESGIPGVWKKFGNLID